MEMTSFDVAAVVYELNQIIKNGRIENIYQINHATLLLKLHQINYPTQQLLIEAGKRVNLTGFVLKKPVKPPAFCMLLRKYLNNGKFQDVQQHEFERTITFKIATREGLFQLIVELFGEGNIILTDPHGTIIAANKYKKMRDRNILRNVPFQHAPPSGKNPFHLTRSQMDELKNFGKLEIVRALTKFLSIGGVYAEELLLRASVDKNIPCQELAVPQLDVVFAQLRTLIPLLREGKFDPAILVEEKGKSIDVTSIPLKRYEAFQRKTYKSFNEALDEYYAQTAKLGKVSEAEKEYERELAKQQRMLENQGRTLEESQKAAEQNKRVGDVIYTHIGELQLLLQEILGAKQKGETWEHIINRLEHEKRTSRTPALYFESLDAKNMVLNVTVEGNTFSLKMSRSIQANAAEYYERMKEAQRRLEGAGKALRETKARIEELQQKWTRKIEETRIEVPSKREKKAWYEKFRWFHSSDGFIVIGGKDAMTNEILIKKYLEPKDIVFHADVVGAPFVIVKTEGKPPTEQTIKEAAQFAASYSRAWRESLGAVDVYWVHPNQVSKTPPSGQYLERGSFIIQGAKNYLRNVSLRIAVGFKKIDGLFKVIGGPVDAVRRQTDMYAEIVPGEETSSRVAKRVRQTLAEVVSKEQQAGILGILVEEIQQFIPLGKGTVSSK